MQVRYQGWEDPLEQSMATHSGILVWRIPGTEEPGGLQSIGLQRIGHNTHRSDSYTQREVTLYTHTHTHTAFITSFQVLPLNPITLGVKASTYEFEKDTFSSSHGHTQPSPTES